MLNWGLILLGLKFGSRLGFGFGLGIQLGVGAPPFSATSAGLEPLDHVVAVVDKAVLTESQLRIESRLYLAWREGEAAAFAPLGPQLMAVLRDWVVDQMLIAGQARRLGSDDVSDEEIATRVTTLMRRFSTPARYAAFSRAYGVTPEGVRDMMARDLRNERYMEQRMRTRLLGGGSAKAMEPERYAAAVKLWLEELRQSAELRLEGPDGQLEIVRGR